MRTSKHIATELRQPADPMREISVAGHELRLYVEVPPLVEDMVRDIRAARSRVWVEVYIFADDAAGRAVAEALIERAKAGLDVRVLYDAFGSQHTSNAFFNELTAAGVSVHAFHTVWYALRRFRFFEIMNRRNHRKLLVVDDVAAYFGGMNLMDRTDPVGPGDVVPNRDESRWHDLHVRMVGPQLAQVAESFERSWRSAHHEHVERRPRAYRRGRLPPGADDGIRFFDSGPGWRHSRATRIYRRLLRRARHSVWLCMAYFLPTPTLLRSLWWARRRGARVRLIVPGLNDVRLVRQALRYLYGRLLRVGIGIYERQDRMLHSKVMVVDDLWSVVGSCNLDPRSLEYNLEFLAVIRSRALAAALVAICREEKRHSRRITKKNHLRRSWGVRLQDRLAYALRWFL